MIKNIISSLIFGILICVITILVLGGIENSNGMSSDYNHPVGIDEADISSSRHISAGVYYIGGLVGLLVGIATFRSKNGNKEQSS